MMRLITLAFVAVALFAATILRSHSISGNEPAKMAMMPSVQELQHATGSSKLPVQEFDDQSLVYPNRASR
jgi:hypothetical protein